MPSITPTNRHANRWRQQGYMHVAGIDEVGRGALAGPVVAAAVVLAPRIVIPGVRDSKVLNWAQRRAIGHRIKQRALAIGLGWASPAEVDHHGLTWAVRSSGRRALASMNHPYDVVLLDGNHNYLREHCPAETVVGGDARCQVVAAASIIAKVARDNYMQFMHQLWPDYHFGSNVGYGTPAHLAALMAGLSPIHRRRFAPVARLSLALAGAEQQDAFFEALLRVD